MENIHYFLNQKDLEAALTEPKVHWDNLEDIKTRKRRIETPYQGQSTLDKCMEEFGRRSAETKRCMANLARLCAVENLPLHMATCVGFVEFMR